MFNSITNSDSYHKGVDWPIIILYLILVVFGWANLYAANYRAEVGLQFTLDSEYFKQLMWIVVSLVCAGALLLSDSKLFVELSWPFYLVSLALLALVLVAGKEVYGAKSWLALGPIQFQPAEFTKIGTALVVAHILSRYGFRWSLRTLLELGAVILVPVVLILLQNDTGSALVYFVFLLAMFREGLSPHVLIIGSLCVVVAIASFLVSDVAVMSVVACLAAAAIVVLCARQDKVRLGAVCVALGLVAGGGLLVVYRYALDRPVMTELCIAAGAAGASLPLLLVALAKRIKGAWWLLAYMWIALVTSFATGYAFEHILIEHQRTRINVLFGLEDDPLGAGYNVNQSLIAIGSGGFAGRGFLQGTQTKLDFVPKQTTDFIFCTVGEEWGFLGSTALIIVYVLFFVRIVTLAEAQHSVFSRVYGYCVAAVFFFHFAINMGMTIGLMPVIGIPLPFFSYGGSSLWGFSVMLFILVKLDTDRNFLIR